MQTQSVIYVVATPIGNLDDISERAKKILLSVDLIAAEDTRRARQLLNHLGRGSVELVSYYDEVEHDRAPRLVVRLQERPLTLALISDAGTPCISDPGFRLIQAAKAAGITVHPIPGPSALTTLVSASGLPSDRILFIGFLPTKKGALEREISSWQSARASIVFYEAPRRLKQALQAIARMYPAAQLAIGRELTKLHEEIVSTDIEGALNWCTSHEFLRGEAVVMLTLGESPDEATQGSSESQREDLKEEARQYFADGLSLRDILRVMQDKGLSRSTLYQLLLEVKGEHERE